MLLISNSFIPLARNQAKILGMPNVPTVILTHPIGGMPIDSVIAKVEAALPEIIEKLTTQLPSDASAGQSASAWVDINGTDEWSDVQSEMSALGWGDGLPLVPPTQARVAAMVAGSGLPGDRIVGTVAPGMGVATVELVAANAVMAGCKPEHMPVLVAALEALIEPQFNLYGCQATTHCVAPLLIVSGPLAKALNINSGNGMFGPGPWANGAIGRAIRLMLMHIGGATPGIIDKATMGHPGKFSFCIAENEDASPWASLRAERGFDPEVSTVTVVGGEAPHNINDHESTLAGGIMTMICNSMNKMGANNIYYKGEPLLILGPEHAQILADQGFSKDDVKRYVYENAGIPLGNFATEQVERRLWRMMPTRYRGATANVRVTIAQKYEDVMVMVAGGAGKHSMYIPTFGATRSVTRAILKADGTPWLASDFGK